MKIIENKRNVPSVFKCIDGTVADKKNIWLEKRRPELLKLFQKEEYGCLPDMSEVHTEIRVVDSRKSEDIMKGRALRNTVEVEAVRNDRHFIFNFVVFIPLNQEHPVPAFVEVCNRGIKDCDPARHFLSPFYPAETIISRGYACAVFKTQDVAPDYEEGFRTCFHRLFPEYADNRPDDAWGAISAWSWAASKVMDYFVQEPLIDDSNVAVIGHSRGGKTALWTAAQDERFKMVVSSCAGNSGDAISRGHKGERISDITKRFPYWFCNNYQKYAGNEDKLPFDQHMLLAIIAPRYIYISSKTFDSWADPEGQFESAVQASPVFEMLGVEGISRDTMPLPEQPLTTGHIGYHYKTGNHDLDEYDWNCVMNYADKIMK